MFHCLSFQTWAPSLTIFSANFCFKCLSKCNYVYYAMIGEIKILLKTCLKSIKTNIEYISNPCKPIIHNQAQYTKHLPVLKMSTEKVSSSWWIVSAPSFQIVLVLIVNLIEKIVPFVHFKKKIINNHQLCSHSVIGCKCWSNY